MAEVSALATVFEKSATKLKPKTKFLRSKNIVNIVVFNVWMLNTVNQLPQLTASKAEHNTNIMCIHRYYHSELEIKYHDTGKR